MPFPYAPFLDYCVRLRLLEKDGGAWRFRHQILQDYFRERGDGTRPPARPIWHLPVGPAGIGTD